MADFDVRQATVQEQTRNQEDVEAPAVDFGSNTQNTANVPPVDGGACFAEVLTEFVGAIRAAEGARVDLAAAMASLGPLLAIALVAEATGGSGSRPEPSCSIASPTCPRSFRRRWAAARSSASSSSCAWLVRR